MKTKSFVLSIIAAAALLLCVSGKKPSLEGTSWKYDHIMFLADVGNMGDEELITFTSATEVKVETTEWVMVVHEGPGSDRMGAGRSTSPVTKEKTGTYTTKKAKVKKKKVTKVFITIEGETSEFTIDGDTMIPATSSLEDQRIYKKQ